MVKGSSGARQRILDAAERLFADHGFDATATSKVATLAAVPKGLVFYYFPAKLDLLRALVAERFGLGSIDAAVLIEPGNPVKSLLNLSTKVYEIQASSEVLRVIIWREQRTHPEVLANLREHHNQLLALIEGVLRGSVSQHIRAPRLLAAAQAWLAILTSRPLADPSAAGVFSESTTTLQQLAELICDGLVPPRAAHRTTV